MSLKSLILGSTAAAMMAFNGFAPPMGGMARPSFMDRQPEYDGLGRKKKIVPAAPTMRSRDRQSWRDFVAKVEATHSDRPDPRHDKYLHSHARQMRGLRNAMQGAGR